MAGAPLRRLRALFPRVQAPGEPEQTRNGLAMMLSLLVAVVLWFTFSMQETYTTTVEVGLDVGSLPEGQALQRPPPMTARVSLQGRGEDLFGLAWTPPRVRLFADGPTVNVAEAIQSDAGWLPVGVSVLGAQPRTIRLDLDESVTVRMPIQFEGRIRAAEPYDLLRPPTLAPDSVTVTGARSLLDGFDAWPTDRVIREDLRDDLRLPIALSDTFGSLVTLSAQSTELNASIVEFAVGDLTLEVEAENVPPGTGIRFEPGTVRATFRSPTGDAFARVEEVGFRAVVDFEDVIRDGGAGTVNVGARVPARLDARSIRFEPSRVEYFFTSRDTTQAER